jgi:hypothetical protein
MASWFVANCGGKKGLGGKVTQLPVSNIIVPQDYETALLAFKHMANAKLLLAAVALDWQIRWATGILQK